MPPSPRRADTCRYPVAGDRLCGAPAAATVPAGTGTLAEDTPMCADHAARFLTGPQP